MTATGVPSATSTIGPSVFEDLGHAFGLSGKVLRAAPCGNGHINDTFAVSFSGNGASARYIFQRINHRVFREPECVMENIDRVLRHLYEKALERGERAPLKLIHTRNGNSFHRDRCGDYWRVYNFIAGVRSHDIVRSPALAFEAARAFGAFQADLADLPPPRLHETIPHFHDTPRRLENLERAVAEDREGRAAAVRPEIEFVRVRADAAGRLLALQRARQLPERITHNDTKLNNVLISDADHRAICVIDLDTVMPGLVHYDFGDMIRTSVSPTPEDEPDLDRIEARFEYFEALLRGYLSSAGAFLTPEERRHLPFSGVLITLEIGARFLTDHIEGDVYFKIHRPGHNLDRARAQFRLVERLEALMPRMTDLLGEIEEHAGEDAAPPNHR